MPSVLLGATCLNLVVLFPPVALCFIIFFLTLGCSLFGGKPTGWPILLHERPRVQLVPPLIMINLLVSKLLLLLKCYKHAFLKKLFFLEIIVKNLMLGWQTHQIETNNKVSSPHRSSFNLAINEVYLIRKAIKRIYELCLQVWK